MSRTRSASRVFNLALTMAAPRYFTSIAGRSSASSASLLNGGSGFLAVGRSASIAGPGGDFQVRALTAFIATPVRFKSTATEKEASGDEKTVKEREENKAAGVGGDEKGIVSYWGVPHRKLVKADGTEWKWNCFMVK